MLHTQHAGSCLSIKELNITLHLGAAELERSVPQVVLCTIHLHFKEFPKACYTDDINDTICYDILTQRLIEHCQRKQYNLIEHLTADIIEFIGVKVGGGILKAIAVEIVKHPVMHASTKCVQFSLCKEF